MMNRFIKLLCAAVLLGIVPGAASAEDRVCKFAEWGYSYYRVEQQGEAWTYLLTVSGPNWRNHPYGYHAPGSLVCEGCSSAGKAWGLYDFSAEAQSRPATAAERAERRMESFGYPSIDFGPEHLDHYGSREGITLGPLTGYAVLYRFVAPESRKTFGDLFAAKAAAQEGRLLVIHLTDGCISFETTMVIESSNDRDPWVVLDSVLRDVTIEKSRGARTGPPPPPGTGYSAIVRPRR